MRLFKRKPKCRQWDRMNIARTIYSTVINQCNREAHTRQQYEQLPQTAARRAVEFADALLKELDK